MTFEYPVVHEASGGDYAIGIYSSIPMAMIAARQERSKQPIEFLYAVVVYQTKKGIFDRRHPWLSTLNTLEIARL